MEIQRNGNELKIRPVIPVFRGDKHETATAVCHQAQLSYKGERRSQGKPVRRRPGYLSDPFSRTGGLEAKKLYSGMSFLSHERFETSNKTASAPTIVECCLLVFPGEWHLDLSLLLGGCCW